MEFGVRVFGEGAGEAVAAKLINPFGEVVGEVDNQFEMHQFHVELEQPSAGEIWTLQIRKPSRYHVGGSLPRPARRPAAGGARGRQHCWCRRDSEILQ
jgi:hypothetical protein